MKSRSLKLIFEEEIRLALDYLGYSHAKIQSLPSDPDLLDAETLETWESFVARFARVTDIFLSKYIRSHILELDPGFRGELRDFVDKAEKNKLIDSADKWMEIRELRNKIAHEYTRADLKVVFEAVKSHTPYVLSQLKLIFP